MTCEEAAYTSFLVKFTGRRPYKQIKEDKEFADELLRRIEFIFINSLVENVRQELYNEEYSTVTDLVTNTSIKYDGKKEKD